MDHYLGLLAASLGESSTAAAHLTAAVAQHHQIGASAWAQLSAREQARPGRTTPAAATPSRFQRDGAVWHITYRGKSIRMPDAKGLHDITHPYMKMIIIPVWWAESNGSNMKRSSHHAGDDLLTWIGHEPAIRAMEQGHPFRLADLSTQTRDALAVLHRTLESQRRDWNKDARQAAEFHSRNAQAWASAASGQDLTGQIDPGFTLDPLAFSS